MKKVNSTGAGTFIVKVDNCQNGSWQGKVVWADENKTEHFRSTLELIRMIDGAMQLGNMEAPLKESGSYE